MTCTSAWHDYMRKHPGTWARQKLVGAQEVEGGVLELRNCRCGSTLALERRGHFWCPGRGGHPAPLAKAVGTDPLGRRWCAACEVEEAQLAIDDARGNDGLVAPRAQTGGNAQGDEP